MNKNNNKSRDVEFWQVAELKNSARRTESITANKKN